MKNTGGEGSIPASDREFEFHASTVVEKQQGGKRGWRTRLKGRLKGARRRERERDLLLVARILSIPRPVSTRRGERRLAHAIPAALATEMERERKKEEEEGDRDGEARRGAERISSEKLTRDAAKTMSRVA